MKKLSQETITSICNYIQQLLPNKEIIVSDVLKNNDLILTGITIKDKNQNIAPTIYIENCIDNDNHIDNKAIAYKIVHDYHKYYQEYKDMSYIQELITDFDKVKPLLKIRLLNKEKNQKRLLQLPHYPFLDLVITIVIEDITIDNTKFFIQVTNDLFKTWKINSIEEILPIAKKNTFNDPYLFTPLSNWLWTQGFTMDMHRLVPMWILKKEHDEYGATELCNTKTMNHIVDLLGSDFYVIPSSIHECLIIPAYLPYKEDITIFKNIILEMNQTQVAHEDILSDNLYLYSKINGWSIVTE